MHNSKKENILILGGTNFIGRNLIESLISKDEYNLTICNRGITNAELFPDISRIYADRNTKEIRKIFSNKWDYIIDLSCYYPKSLQFIVDEIREVKNYVFISTCSVYDNKQCQTILRNELAPTLTCDAEQYEDETWSTYGNRKAECERILVKSGLPYSILRPALVYGKYDHTDRFYYWLYQTRKELKLLFPNGGNQLFSVTYVSDLIDSIIKCIEAELNNSIFNVISLPTCSIASIVHNASAFLDRAVDITHASSKFLKHNDVAQWSDLPLWLDSDYFTYDNFKMKNALHVQPTSFSKSVEQTCNFYKKALWPEPKFGMSNEKKKQLLKALENNL